MPLDDRTNTVGMYDAKTHFAELAERVENGEEITITRHGMPVMKWVPTKRRSTPEEVRAIFERMRKAAKGRRATPAEIKRWMAEGRR